MKKNKQIIAFIGDEGCGKTTASNFLAKHGFHKVEIINKVNDFARYLFTQKQFDCNKKEILENIRKRGCLVNKEYWINLVLISVPDSANRIVFDELMKEEIVNNKIKVYQIIRPNATKVVHSNVETIQNDGKLDEFYNKLLKLIVEK